MVEKLLVFVEVFGLQTLQAEYLRPITSFQILFFVSKVSIFFSFPAKMEDSKLTFAKDETTNEIRFKLETEGRTFTKETATFGYEINGKAKKTMAATYWKPKVSSGLFTNIDLFRFFHLMFCSMLTVQFAHVCVHS